MAASGGRLPLPSFSLMPVSLVLGLVYLSCNHKPLLADPDIGWHLRDAQPLFAGIIVCPLLAKEATFLGQDNSLLDKRWLNTGIVALVLGFAVRTCLAPRKS